MRKYETIIIFDSRMSDEEVASKAEGFKKFLEDNQATEVIIDSWGKRELAYEFDRRTHGSYSVFYFEAAEAGLGGTSIVQTINESLRIDEQVVKFQTHRIAEAVRKFKGRISSDDESSSTEQAA